jgi:predicted CXXCH cytochrome family protein
LSVMTRSRVVLLSAATLLLVTLTLSVRLTGVPIQPLDTAASFDEPAVRGFVVEALVQAEGARPATRFSSPVGDSTYVGSASCARCHEDAYDDWRRSLHIRMTKPIAEATVLGDFSSGRPFTDHGRAYQFGRADGKPFVRITFGTTRPETFPVDYTLGAKRYQGYLSKLPDGRMYVLPVFWHVESRRWVDWKEITPIPEGAHDLRQIWNTNCFNCHATNLAQGFDVMARRYDSTWTEMGIGCEACHGPGKAHNDLMASWEKDPASKPTYDNSAANRELGSLLRIFSPRSAPTRQVFDTCAYCHGNKRNLFLGFRAGDRYEDYALPYLISAPIPSSDKQGEFWPDGRPNRFNRPQALTLSGCFKAGEVACTNCHVAHGSRNPFSLKVNITQGRTGDLLCTQCHAGASQAGGADGAGKAAEAKASEQSLAVPPASPAQLALPAHALPKSTGPRSDAAVPWTSRQLEAHTFHPAASTGSRCIGCHMSDVNWRLLIRRRDHTFQPPVPEMTVSHGVPNACTTCHDDKPPEWAVRYMDQWWGDGERRRTAVNVADTMYRAGSGDPAVLPQLARLAVDRSQGLLVRASAVEFMEQLALGTAGMASADAQSQTSFADGAGPAARVMSQPAKLSPAAVNALIGAASDPEPTVRARAVMALLASGERDRIIPPLTARLVDEARVVRISTAETLLALGIVELPGTVGTALARAQDEYADALQAFGDTPSNHAALGWLESERGHVAEANAALDRAIHLNPRAARPYVIKGVIAARAERFREAADLWRKARDLEPSYPNIDRLIEEAEKRK